MPRGIPRGPCAARASSPRAAPGPTQACSPSSYTPPKKVKMTSTRMLKQDGLVKVARAQNQSEAELVQGLLRNEGVPSVLRRAPGFDVPDFLAAGKRDVLVPASAEGLAREVLPQGDTGTPVRASIAVGPSHLLAGVFSALSLVAIIAWLGALVA